MKNGIDNVFITVWLWPICDLWRLATRSAHYTMEMIVMRESLKRKIIEVCDKKILTKGANAAHWWIMVHKLDHFEKAVKIKSLLI